MHGAEEVQQLAHHRRVALHRQPCTGRGLQQAAQQQVLGTSERRPLSVHLVVREGRGGQGGAVLLVQVGNTQP